MITLVLSTFIRTDMILTLPPGCIKTTSSSTNMPNINQKPTNSAHDAHDGCQYEHETDHDTSKVDARYGVDYHEYVGVTQLSVDFSVSWQPCSWSDRLEGIIVLQEVKTKTKQHDNAS